ncbi:H-NS histone family protein [Cupriavidus necator]|uniref:H-NS histone family protein n=1 Tax=Cupriavidus necator TaxID=106590 RepID=UPI0039C103AD
MLPQCREAHWGRAGLTMEELKAAGCFDPPPPPPPPAVCYRNAEGLTWDRQGEMPDSPRRAVNVGQSVEFFRIG